MREVPILRLDLSDVAKLLCRCLIFSPIGVAVIVATFVACVMWRRRSGSSKENAPASGGTGTAGMRDIENGGGGSNNTLAPYSSASDRAFAQMARGTSEKSGPSRSSGSAHPYSSETSETRGRSRTPSRIHDGATEQGEYTGPRMISRTPSRSFQGNDEGPRMYTNTPSRDSREAQQAPRMYTPHRDGGGPSGSHGPPGPRMFSSSPGISNAGAQGDQSTSIFSSTPGCVWEEPMGQRRMYNSNTPRGTPYEEKVRVMSRSLSTGRDRWFSRAEAMGEEGMPPLPRPMRRPRSRSPDGAMRRSRSERYNVRSMMQRERDPWERHFENHHELRGIRNRSPEPWVEGDPRLIKRSKSASPISAATQGSRDGVHGGTQTFGEYRKTLRKGLRRGGDFGGSRLAPGSSTRNRAYRSGLVSS